MPHDAASGWGRRFGMVKRTAWLTYAFLAGLVVLALAGMATAYAFYRDTLQSAQEDNLATMAQGASANLTSFFDMRVRELEVKFSPTAVSLAVQACSGNVDAALNNLLADFKAQGATDPAVVGVELRRVDSDAPDGASSADVPTSCTWAYDDEIQGFRLTLLHHVYFDGELVCQVAEAVDLNTVYDEVLGSVQVGKIGYCTVKDPDRVIVMHRLRGQIGVDTQVQRVEGHPEGDWNALFSSQYSGEPGCKVVTSYWWDNPSSGLAKKFIGYAPAYICGNFFVVNVVMAYDELMEPLRQMLALCTVLGATVVALFVVGGWRLAKSLQNARHLKRELAYEQELHAQTQRLRLQERQIQSIDRLQTMGVVTSSLAHELKNLMTPLSIYGEMLRDETLSAQERAEVSAEVGTISQRCTELLERMLSYVRTRVPKADRAPFDASQAIEDSLVIVRALCPRNVRLEEDIAHDPVWIEGEGGSISQIVLNLVTNALYAMKDSGGVLGVSWGPDEERPATWCLRVSDTGCGMDEAVRAQLFSSFFTTKGEDGTGLGMAVVQALVQDMHGSIEVRSAPGEGSTFLLRFPAPADGGTLEP